MCVRRIHVIQFKENMFALPNTRFCLKFWPKFLLSQILHISCFIFFACIVVSVYPCLCLCNVYCFINQYDTRQIFIQINYHSRHVSFALNSISMPIFQLMCILFRSCSFMWNVFLSSRLLNYYGYQKCKLKLSLHKFSCRIHLIDISLTIAVSLISFGSQD